jgi:hypothetical protein
MSNRKAIAEIVFALFILCLLIQPVFTQTKLAKYPLTEFENGCMGKGRVQDCTPGSVTREILADGKNAIPVLISQLTETARTKYQIADYWGRTRSGDVAFVLLNDLFTDTDLRTFGMPGVPDWSAVHTGCNQAAQACWDEYLRKHGRMSIRKAWQRAWNSHKSEIHWDAKAKCFRVSNT